MSLSLKVRLGRGKTIETYHARLAADGKALEVALKKPRPEAAANEEFTRAFVDWGRRLIEVDGPNVIGVLEAGKNDDGAYVIQELVVGAPLERALRELRKRSRTFKLELALEVAKQMSLGLAQLEAKGQIPHGAIDPGEILIGNDGVVKVGDQGLHRIDWIAGPDVKLPPTYLAPEMVADPTKPTPTGDVYSAGLVILEMLIGQPIWTKESMSVEDSVAALRDFSHLAAAKPAVTTGLVSILEKALAEQPEARFATLREFSDAIVRLCTENFSEKFDKPLGDFISALFTGSDDDAPTMIAGAEAPESDHKKERVRLHTVMVDPDIEKKARATAATKKRPSQPKVADPASRVGPAARKAGAGLDPSLMRKVIAFIVVVIIALSAILMSGSNEPTPAEVEAPQVDEPADAPAENAKPTGELPP